MPKHSSAAGKVPRRFIRHPPSDRPQGLLIFRRILAADLTLQGKGYALGLGVPAFLSTASCKRVMPHAVRSLPCFLGRVNRPASDERSLAPPL